MLLSIRSPSTLFCQETRVQTHGLEVSTQLWVLPNDIACGDLYFIWFSHITYNNLMNWCLRSLKYAHQYHSLKQTKKILKHLNISKAQWMNINPRKWSWVQSSRQLLFKATGMLANTYIPAAAAKSLQPCPTLCDPTDGSPPGSPIPGTFQARTLEWVAISFSNAWKWKVKGKSLSRVRLLATPWTAAHQAPPSMGFSRQESWSGVPKQPQNTFLFLWGLKGTYLTTTYVYPINCMKIRKEKSLVCFACCHKDHRVQLTHGVRQRSISHLPLLVHSKCHTTSNW